MTEVLKPLWRVRTTGTSQNQIWKKSTLVGTYQNKSFVGLSLQLRYQWDK